MEVGDGGEGGVYAGVWFFDNALQSLQVSEALE